jgi:pyridoxamine 5'-phosphate oxidase
MASYRSLLENEIDPDPYNQFDIWYKERLNSGTEVPDAVSLGTATPSGKVSVRIVLLKEFDEKGFVFYTNYNSRKASELLSNHKAALLFYWPESGRQVRIEGVTIRYLKKSQTITSKPDPGKARSHPGQVTRAQ